MTPDPLLPFTIEPMTLADIPAAIAVEHASYSMTWPAKAYDYELQNNNLAHYFVLRTFLTRPPRFNIELSSKYGGQPSAVSGLTEETGISPGPPTMIGLAGFWLMADEIHISTIAVQPDWRGLGLGEWLLLHLFEAGLALEAAVVTLEVRPSNGAALALYQKYCFEQVGRRRHYYSDNDEDALILTTPALTSPDYQAMLAQRRESLYQRLSRL
jgi:ribosomal-protein-alanine N-acetyltransferase